MTCGVSCFSGIDLYNIISWEDQNMPSSIRHERWKLLVFSLYQVCFFSLFFKNSFETWWCQKKIFSLDLIERTLFCFIFPLICRHSSALLFLYLWKSVFLSWKVLKKSRCFAMFFYFICCPWLLFCLFSQCLSATRRRRRKVCFIWD